MLQIMTMWTSRSRKKYSLSVLFVDGLVIVLLVSVLIMIGFIAGYLVAHM